MRLVIMQPRTPRTLLVWIAVGLILSPASSAVAQSLRQHAQRYGGTAQNIINTEFGIARLPDLTALADLILEATVTDITPHLTPDERLVVTDYSIAPIRVVKSDSRLVTASRPGTVGLRVRRLGGTVQDGSYRYSTVATVYPPTEEFKLGQNVVLFLTYNQDEQVYYFAGGPFGAFRVDGSQVVPMTKDAASRRGDTPRELQEFLVNVRELLGKR